MPMRGGDLVAFLAEPRLCHFATVGPDGRPRVRPLWYVHAEGALWFTTRLEARRTEADLVAGSAAAVSIASEDRPYRAVIAWGTPEVWTEDRDAWLERIAVRYGEASGRRWLAHAVKEPDRVVLRMVPERVLSWDYGSGDSSDRLRGLAVELP
jgi:PPOX class probable F420-dependent enzyme